MASGSDSQARGRGSVQRSEELGTGHAEHDVVVA